MKSSILTLITFSSLLTLRAAPACTNTTGVVFTFDINGDGTLCLSGLGPQQPITFDGALEPFPINPDPITHFEGNELEWNFSTLGISFPEGEVLIEYPGSNFQDELTFTDPSGSLTGSDGYLLYFSSNDEIGTNLGDTGNAPTTTTIVVTGNTSGNFTYTGAVPNSSSPGPVVYNGFDPAGTIQNNTTQSDPSSTPEPATIAISGAGILLLFIAMRRRVRGRSSGA